MSFNLIAEASNLKQGINPVRPMHVGDMVKLAESKGWRVVGILPIEYTQDPKFPNLQTVTLAGVVLVK